MKLLRRRFLLVICLAALTLAACRATAPENEPPQILYGQEICDWCKMIISEERHAAAYWTADGQARRFDDIGGMLSYALEHGEDGATFWVHDFFTGDWLRAEEATFVLNGDPQTPMGFGLVACADSAKARALAFGNEDAEVLSFATLADRLDAGTLALEPLSGHAGASMNTEDH